jgi:hypothetical protein
MRAGVISSISTGFPELSQSQGQVTHVLLTRSPLITAASCGSPFDLHVLSTPPAFVLSQDQTLRRKNPLQKGPNPAKPTTHTNQPRTKRGQPAHAASPLKRPDTNHKPTPQKGKPTANARTNKLGINFWHAVEFSRIGHTPTKATPQPAQPRPGQPPYCIRRLRPEST